MSASVIIDLNIIADVLEFFCNETQNNLGGITMRQIGTQSAKYFRRFVTAMLVFAMVITSLTVSSVDSQAAKKVKKVTIGVKVGGSGILVLKKGQSKKLKVSVTPKKASKKVTYKSSKASIVSVSSKGVVKARKSKGSAKITVTSKQNAKKKATITVKIGTPVKKVAISKNATSTWSSANYTIVEKNGQKTKVYPKYTDKLKAKKNTFKLMNGRNMVIKASVSPKKATRKSLKWSTNKGSVLKVVGNGTKATVIARKVGKANVIAQATDGSGKKAVVKVTVTKFKSDKTPAPTAEPDTRKKTLVEDFESYEVGTKWERYTAGGFANSGTMTVVQDPEDPTNKCLKVTYDGADQSFDFAPAFQADLSKLKDSEGKSTAGKTLGSYTGIGFDSRIVSNDPSSVQYKKAFCYFDQADAIKHTDYFAASKNSTASAHVDKDGNKVDAGAANEFKPLRFGVNVSMAEGSDKENGITLYNGQSSKESNKYFPFAYSIWEQANAATHFAKDSCTAGYKDSETDANMKVGFATRSLTFDKSRINEADSTLVNQSKFDFVLGSTYEGGSKFKVNNVSATLYLDNIALIEEDIPVTGFELSAGDNPRVAPGNKLVVEAKYTPEDTTQKGLTWTTNNDKVKVDANGNVTVDDDFFKGISKDVKEVSVVVTATSTFNPALTKSVTITVYRVETPKEPLVLTADMFDAEMSGEGITVTKMTDADGKEFFRLHFAKNQTFAFFKLPQEVDLSAYGSLEFVGNTTGQLTFRMTDNTFVKDMEKWWEKVNCIEYYPFFKGSYPYRPKGDISVDDFMAKYPELDRAAVEKAANASGILPDGTAVGPRGIETITGTMKDITKDAKSSNKKATYFVFSLDQKGFDDDGASLGWDEGVYDIYSIKFIPKADDDADVESPSVEIPAN